MSTVENKGWAGGERWVKVRLVSVGVVFTGLFAVLAYRAWNLQVRETTRMKEMAEDQYLREIELPARRGRILDRNGAELAVSVEVASVYANPRQIQASAGVEAAAAALAKPLDMDRRELLKRLHTRRYFSWLKRRVLPEEARAVRELNLPGVFLTTEPRRYYPNRSLAGPVLGWAGLDGKGLEGIELRLDKELKGAPAEVQGLRDALGREVMFSGLGDAPPQGGHDVVTTLDKFIQYRLERALEDGVVKHRARAASAIALDPRTGEILAMASVPTVNPNDPTAAQAVVKERGVRNRPVTDPFEPGSTMKTFTMAGALAAGVVRPDEKWWCENGHYKIGAATVHDADPMGVATTVEVLAKSSNICTAKIARRLGRDRLDAMLRRFGFGAQLGVDLPGERAGQLRPVKRWGEIELATISFGQGVTATQLQIASGYAAIANGGTLYKPHIVRRILDEKGALVVEVPPEGRRVLDEGPVRALQAMLRAVTEKGGTGDKLAIPGYPAGGKTGTAQKVDPLTRRYSAEKWMSSFVGFAPFQSPRLVIMVTVDEPADTHYGGAVAGPIWREVMLDALRYLNVTPVDDGSPAAAAHPASAAHVAPQQESPAASQQATSVSVGAVSGAVAAEEESEEAADEDGEPRPAVAGPEDSGDAHEIPDFTGLSIGEALEVARRLRLPVEVAGSGRAVGQSPGPGPAREGAHCRIRFAD